MATVPQKTLSWLYDVLKREYRDPNRTYSDLAQTLSRHPALAPRTEVYTFENGTPALLVHLVGTLPVTFRGTVYRFPIALWIPHTYPHDAPMIYVTPTEDMRVRPGQHVGGDGRVYHPYLAHWRKAWDRSNVVDFLSILSNIFAKEPPVMSKQQTGQRSVQAQPPPPPRPPLPQEAPRPPPQPSPLSQRQTGAPPPPPKQSVHDVDRSNSPAQPRPGRYDAPPPLPPQSQFTGRPTSISQQFPQGNGDLQRPPSGLRQIPQRNSGFAQSIPTQQARAAQQWQGYQQQQPPPPHQSHPQPPTNLQQPQTHPPGPNAQNVPQQYPLNYPTQQQPQQRPLQHQLPSEPVPQAQPHKPPPPNLLDSPFDISLPTTATSNLPAPPIPRNPEKDALLSHLSHVLTTTLHSQIAQNTTALPALHSQYTALVSTLSTLQSEIASLSTLNTTLQSNIALLTSSLTSATQTITSSRARAKKGDIPPVDDMLVAPTVVAKQLYDNVCEERGIEAGIWALHEGFVRGRVGVEVWARRTRELAREGFRRRWIARRVGRGLALDGA